jgi:DNA-binding protein YbaB
MLDTFKQMQGRLQEAQETTRATHVHRFSRRRMVSVECDGKMQLRRIKLERTVVNPDDIEMLETSSSCAAAEAQKKAADAMQEEMGKVTGGIDLPFKLPF